MLSTDERIIAVQARSRTLQSSRNRRRGIAIPTISTAACVAAIVVVAFAIAGVIEKAPAAPSGTSNAFGSILAAGGMLGYIVIGLLAFCLGVAVTLLCVKIKEFPRDRSDAVSIDDAGKDGRR